MAAACQNGHVRVDPVPATTPAAALIAACGSPTGGAPAAAPTATATTAPTRPPTLRPTPRPDPARPGPTTVCTNQLTHWAGEDLRGAPDAGFDYQHRGLTGAQADALAVLVDEARARGPDLPPDWVATRARALCTAIAARPAPTGGGWP